MMKMINYLFNFEKFVMNEALFDQSLTNVYGKKWIVYFALSFGIQSLLISIWFKLDQIVSDWPNIAITYFWPSNISLW